MIHFFPNGFAISVEFIILFPSRFFIFDYPEFVPSSLDIPCIGIVGSTLGLHRYYLPIDEATKCEKGTSMAAALLCFLVYNGIAFKNRATTFVPLHIQSPKGDFCNRKGCPATDVEKSKKYNWCVNIFLLEAF